MIVQEAMLPSTGAASTTPRAVKILLQHKADKNLRTDPDGHTPLMKAAAYNAAACVELLLRARCDATATDNDGRTALHHAAKNKATLCAHVSCQWCSCGRRRPPQPESYILCGRRAVEAVRCCNIGFYSVLPRRPMLLG